MTSLAFARTAEPVCASTPALKKVFGSDLLFPSFDDLFTPNVSPPDTDPVDIDRVDGEPTDAYLVGLNRVDLTGIDVSARHIASNLDTLGLTDSPENRAAAIAEVRASAIENDLEAADLAEQSQYVHEQARAACRRCPLLEQCLSSALRHGFDGMWGGTTTSERADIRAERGIAVQVLDIGVIMGARVHLQDSRQIEQPGRADSTSHIPDDVVAYYSDRGMPAEEIAEILDATPRTIIRSRSRARANPGASTARRNLASTGTASVNKTNRSDKPTGPARKTPERLHAERVSPPTAVLYDVLSDGLAHSTEELLSVISAVLPAAQAYEEGVKPRGNGASLSRDAARARGANSLAQNRLYILRRDQYAEHNKTAKTYVMAPAALSEWLAYRALHPAPQTPYTPGVDQDGRAIAVTAAQINAEADRILSI